MDRRFRATSDAYDSAAADFAARTAKRSDMAAEFFDLFTGSLKPASLVADLGCGPGHDLRRLVSLGHRPLGVDSAAGLLRLGSAEAACARGDLRMLPLAPRSLNGIWSSAALLHVDRADLKATLAEWNRALAPGGSIGFATSLGNDEGWEVVPASHNRVPEIVDGHQRWFVHHRRESLIAAVEGVGWQIMSAEVRISTRDWLQVLATKR